MRDNATAKKRGDPMTGAIVKLVGNQKIQRLQIFLQGADRAHGDDSLDAQLFHRMNVGAVIDLRRKEAVPARVAREEGDTLSLERTHHKGVGWIPKGRSDAHLAWLLEPRHVVKTAASDDANAN